LKKEPKRFNTKDGIEVVEDIDFYIENGYYVFTAYYLERRGYCCGNNCRHCPYSGSKKKKNNG